ncbi:TMEM9 [Popillia japonica]|uniref:TMEM9 n=1 Tax=Popillia japonica TaxID=7064 RepID=A0AAW1LT82_POPJA
MEGKKRRGAARYCAVTKAWRQRNVEVQQGIVLFHPAKIILLAMRVIASFLSPNKQTGKIPDLAEQSHNVGEANIEVDITVDTATQIAHKEMDVCQTQVHVLPDAELTPEAVDDYISEPGAADDVFVPKPGPSHRSLLTQNTPRKTKLRRELLKVKRRVLRLQPAPPRKTKLRRELLKVKRRVLRLQPAPEAIPTKQGFLKQCDIHLSSELAAIVKFNEIDILEMKTTVALAVLFIFITSVKGQIYENNRCKCICPSVASVNTNSNSTQPSSTSNNLIIVNVPPNKCNCDGVIIPKLGDAIKGKEQEFCPRCECKYENRNITIIKVVVIIVIWVISILVIYMAFLIILDPLLNKRVKGNYQEHTNEETYLLLQDETAAGIGGPMSHNMSVRGNVFNRVGHEQDKWKKQVKEQRRNIYDRHTMLN